MRSGQAAFEYMAIVIVAIVFIIPLWYYGFNANNGVTDDLSLTYAKNAAKRLAGVSDLVYSQRQNATSRVMIHMPKGITEASLNDGYIMLKVMTSNGEVTIYEETKANLTGTLPTEKGDYYFTIRAMGDYVNITL